LVTGVPLARLAPRVSGPSACAHGARERRAPPCAALRLRVPRARRSAV